ncbi:FAD-dependent monooxygenase [Chitinophaga vietnamensis]|uniref:FAD-dependent monooxygenase n=1 Tax=Chitinophaga vietnamensis TaxID=2593957 RepID=UPI0011775ED4|nr:FAD-dependent monooxygenase [Chitinophaga vietnamensis]
MKAQNHATYDVIISGAGPVGLFLACELALAQCTVLILEKAEQPQSPLKQLPFGMRGLSAPAIEAFYRRGLLDELTLHKRIKNPHHQPTPPPRPQGGHFAGIPFYLDEVDTSQWPYQLPGAIDTSLLTEMQELETVLTRRAATLGVEILRGLAVSGFHQTADDVRVQCGDDAFTCQWLVGCDGSRSAVRKAAGFDFAGTEPEFTGYTVQVDLAGAEQLKPGRNLTPQGMYLQSQPGYIVIQDFDGGAFHQSDKPITREHVEETLRRISGVDVSIKALHVASTWTDRARQVTAYRKGRVLLAGDAAHIHSPLGGQGLNLGLGDAMNLGWKLAATIRHKAPEGLLDSYHTERYPIGAQVLDWSRAQVAIMKPDPAARALHAIVRDLIHTRDGATYMAGRIRGVFMQYPLEGHHPLTGRTAPDFELEDAIRIGELMHDGKGILLDFHHHPALQALAAAYGQQLKYIAATPKDSLGASALLIRPDGIVAWATDTDPDRDEPQQAIARWFVAEVQDLYR